MMRLFIDEHLSEMFWLEDNDYDNPSRLPTYVQPLFLGEQPNIPNIRIVKDTVLESMTIGTLEIYNGLVTITGE